MDSTDSRKVDRSEQSVAVVSTSDFLLVFLLCVVLVVVVPRKLYNFYAKHLRAKNVGMASKAE